PLLSLHLRQRRFRLGQPEHHVHGTVQHDGRDQLGARVLLLADRGIQPAATPVAVGHERAPRQFVSQGGGLAIAGFGVRAVRRLARRRNVTESGAREGGVYASGAGAVADGGIGASVWSSTGAVVQTRTAPS